MDIEEKLLTDIIKSSVWYFHKKKMPFTLENVKEFIEFINEGNSFVFSNEKIENIFDKIKNMNLDPTKPIPQD